MPGFGWLNHVKPHSTDQVLFFTTIWAMILAIWCYIFQTFPDIQHLPNGATTRSQRH